MLAVVRWKPFFILYWHVTILSLAANFLQICKKVFGNLIKRAPTLKFILFIISTIVLKFYTQVCFCICFGFLFVFLIRFLIMNRKRVKMGHFWKQITLTVFNYSKFSFTDVFGYILRKMVETIFHLVFYCIFFSNLQTTYSLEAWVPTKNIFNNLIDSLIW